MLEKTADSAERAPADGDSHDTLPPPPNSTSTAHGAAAAAIALTLAACGGGGGGDSPPPAPAPTPTPTPTPTPPSYALDAADMEAARVLLHAQFAATDTDIAAVRAQGRAAWLDAQLDAPMGEKAWDWFNGKGYASIDDFRFYDNGETEIDYALAYQCVRHDSVRKRVALALSEYFVVSVVGLNQPWRHLLIAHYWDQLNEHAFGNFRQLLEAVTLSPAMGAYLNTKGNLKEDPATGRVPDENYAREVMQLFTLGLVTLNVDGSVQRDVNGQPIPVYTQDDVSQLARVFTGYDRWNDGRFFPSANDGNGRPYPEYTRQAMQFDASKHSSLAVDFLGASIPANTPGPTALGTALDTLFNHSNVGPFFARQMIQRLVTSNPSPGYVARVAAKFGDNGAGVRGDLKAVWKAILLDDEAVGSASLASATFGKVREPMIRTFQWARTFNVSSAAGTWKWNNEAWNPLVWFGQRPFGSPSVFNFYRPGYVPPGTALAANGATAPEFQILNESTISQWANFCEQMVQRGLYVVWPDKPGGPNPYAGPYPGDGYDIKADYSAEIALAADPPALMRRLNLLLCAGQLSEATQQKIVAILTGAVTIANASSSEEKRQRVAAAITLVMCTPEYLVQK